MVIGLIIGGVVLLVVAAGVVVYFVVSAQVRAHEERIKREGQLRMCWIARANETLYEVYDVPGYAEAHVVFTTEDAPDLEERLKEATWRLTEGKIVDENADVDQIEEFYEKYKNHRWLHPPLRLPKWLVGNFKAYTAVVQIYWRRLPQQKLTLPYVYAHALVGEDGGLVMAEYPARKRAAARED